MGPNNNRAVGLIFSNAGGPIRAVMTLAAKLKTVADFAAFLLGQFATVGAGLSRRTERLSLHDADIEGFDPIFLC